MDVASDAWVIAPRGRRQRAAPAPPSDTRGAAGGATASARVRSNCAWTAQSLCAALSTLIHRFVYIDALDAAWANVARWIARHGGTRPRVVCLGLGAVSDAGPSANSVAQLAFLLLVHRMVDEILEGAGAETILRDAPALQRRLARDVTALTTDASGLSEARGAGAWACAHDPVFTDADFFLLAALGVRASQCSDFEGCCFGGAACAQPTLFFMPHCPWTLYARVLAECEWEPPGVSVNAARLPHTALCIVGNSFSSYRDAGDGGQQAAPSFWDRARAVLADAAVGPEARPAADADAIATVLGMIRAGAMRLNETQLDVQAAARRDNVFSDALSCTSVHTFST